MSVNRVFAIVVSMAVLLVTLGGLYLAGSPSEQRLLRLDRQRVNDLQLIARAIDSYRKDTDTRPTAIDALVDGRALHSLPVDPETGQNYVFESADPDTYRLCAGFARPTKDPKPQEFWAHEAGYQCFDFEYVDED